MLDPGWLVARGTAMTQTGGPPQEFLILLPEEQAMTLEVLPGEGSHPRLTGTVFWYIVIFALEDHVAYLRDALACTAAVSLPWDNEMWDY